MGRSSPSGSPPGPLVIGLTGPIGCGKSTVARMLGELGATIVDADALARQATDLATPTLPEIRARFGDAVFDARTGALDRIALGRIVFGDAEALADLERIVHPHVRQLADDAIEAAAENGDPVVVVEAIKLVEGGLAGRCHEVWLVECAPQTQLARLAARGMAASDAAQRTAAQGAGLVERLAALLAGRRHRRVSTDGSLEATQREVEQALAEALDAIR